MLVVSLAAAPLVAAEVRYEFVLFLNCTLTGGTFSSAGGAISIPATLPSDAMDGNGLICLTFARMLTF